MWSIFWSVYARSYDNLAKHFCAYQDLVREVCDHIDEYAAGRSLRVLDAGCGTGNYSLELARRGHTVIGIDYSEGMLDRARRKSPGIGQVTFIEHDLTEPLPFADGEFDAAVSSMVLYTLPEPRPLLTELRRTAGDGGRLVLVTSATRSMAWASVKEIAKTPGFIPRLRAILALVPVGILNVVIDVAHATGDCVFSTPEGLRADLGLSGWRSIDERRAYAGDTALLFVSQAD